MGGLSPSTRHVPPNPVGGTEHPNRPDSKPAHDWPALKPGKAASPPPASGPSQADWLEGANEKGPDTRWDTLGLGRRKLLCSAHHRVSELPRLSRAQGTPRGLVETVSDSDAVNGGLGLSISSELPGCCHCGPGLKPPPTVCTKAQ